MSTKNYETNNMLAISYLLLGMLLLSSMDAVAKMMMDADYPVVQVMAVRSWIILPVMIVWMSLKGRASFNQLKTKRWKAHVSRAAIGFCAPFFFFYALTTMPLADATVLFFTAPFIMTALSIPWFGEKVGLHRWFSIIIGFVGVVIIIQPGSDTFQPSAVLAMIGCIAYSLISLMARWMGDTETSFSMVFYFNLGVGVIASAALPFYWAPILMEHAWLFVAVALLALLGHICLTKAFTIGEIATITPFEYSSLIWAVLFGYLFWGDFPKIHVWAGTGIIVTCGLYILYREKKKSREITPPITDLP